MNKKGRKPGGSSIELYLSQEVTNFAPSLDFVGVQVPTRYLI